MPVRLSANILQSSNRFDSPWQDVVKHEVSWRKFWALPVNASFQCCNLERKHLWTHTYTNLFSCLSAHFTFSLYMVLSVTYICDHLKVICETAVASFTPKQPQHFSQAVLWWGLAVNGSMMHQNNATSALPLWHAKLLHTWGWEVLAHWTYHHIITFVCLGGATLVLLVWTNRCH